MKKPKPRNPVAKEMLEDDQFKTKVVQSKRKKHERKSSKQMARTYTEHYGKEEDWDGR